MKQLSINNRNERSSVKIVIVFYPRAELPQIVKCMFTNHKKCDIILNRQIIPIFYKKQEEIIMRKSKRLAALFCAAALIISAAACSGGGDTASGSSDSGSSGSAVSVASDSSETGSGSASDSSETSSGSASDSGETSSGNSSDSSAPAAKNVLDWKFREVKEPEGKDPVYTTHPETVEEFEKETTTAKPEAICDYENAKEIIKKSPRFAGLEFAEIVNEMHNYYLGKSNAMYNKPKKTITFAGFDTDVKTANEEYFQSGLSDSHAVVSLSVSQDYSHYDLPDSFKLTIKNTDMTQDEIYEEVKAIFGSEWAEYLVYQQDESGNTDEHSNTMNKEIKTPNKNCSYSFQRYVSTVNGKTIARFNVIFYAKLPGNPPYENGFTPVEWAIPLSQMLKVDVGGSDYRDPDTFFNKAFSANTKYDSYDYSSIDGLDFTQAIFSDGSAVERIYLSGYRLPKDNPYIPPWGSISDMDYRHFILETTLKKDAENNVTLNDISLRYPLGYYSAPGNNINKDVLNDFLDIGTKTLTDLFGVDSKALENMTFTTDEESMDPEHPEINCRKSGSEIYVNFFGNDCRTKVTIYAEAIIKGAKVKEDPEYGAFMEIKL